MAVQAAGVVQAMLAALPPAEQRALLVRAAEVLLQAQLVVRRMLAPARRRAELVLARREELLREALLQEPLQGAAMQRAGLTPAPGLVQERGRLVRKRSPTTGASSSPATIRPFSTS